MEQRQEPHSLRAAEGAGVHPPRHLGGGRTRTQEARRDRQEPHRAADPAPRGGQGAGEPGTLAEGPSGSVRAGQRGLPGVSRYHCRDSESVGYAPEERGRERTQETRRQAAEGQVLLTRDGRRGQAPLLPRAGSAVRPPTLWILTRGPPMELPRTDRPAPELTAEYQS